MQSIPDVHKKTHLAATIYLERMPPNQREVWAKRADQALSFFMGGDTEHPARLGERWRYPLRAASFGSWPIKCER